jgi:hypothetical protein
LVGNVRKDNVKKDLATSIAERGSLFDSDTWTWRDNKEWELQTPCTKYTSGQ